MIIIIHTDMILNNLQYRLSNCYRKTLVNPSTDQPGL